MYVDGGNVCLCMCNNLELCFISKYKIDIVVLNKFEKYV